jgi:UMF1 family MFS transporter
VLHTLKNLKKYPGTARFLLSRFFYLDSLQSIYVFAIVFLSLAFKLTDMQIQYFAVLLLIFAVIGGLLSGPLIRKIGSKKHLTMVLLILITGLAIISLTNNIILVLVFGSILGFAQGSIWSVDRVIIAQLSPRKQITEFFGLYAILNRFANIIGPLIWGTVVTLLTFVSKEFAYRAAMGTLVILLVIALIIFIPLKIPEKIPAPRASWKL